MGFAFLYQATGDSSQLENAIHFLTELKKSRCPGFKEYCWGYPFNWVTRNGTIKEQTPLITTTPYCYEAFLQVFELTGRDEWKVIVESIARHAAADIKDFRTSERASSSSYTPFDKGGVVNAAAYRAFLLTSASKLLAIEDYWKIAERNLNFVLESQNADGSWFYAMDGVRDFVDHYHTCFVMKAIAKIYALTGYEPCKEALSKGIKYYLENLFDEDGLPKPFSKAPRLTVYKRELYDWAECINLCLLLRDRFPELDRTLEKVVTHILEVWVKRDGSFRSRKLQLGWDNVPMHRWGQSQMFRSLAFYLSEARRVTADKSRARECYGPATTTARFPTCITKCAASQASLTSSDTNPWSARPSCGWRVPSRIADQTMKASSSPGLSVWDSGDYQSSISPAVISRCRIARKPCG